MTTTTVSEARAPATADHLAILALSGERDGWLGRVLAAERAGYIRGLADGQRQGRELAHRELTAAWQALAAPIARGGPSYAELDAQRWGAGGRAHFADARPGDYQGGAL